MTPLQEFQRKQFNDRVNQWQDESLIKGGFDPATLTKDQKYIILEPSEAPENFMCDGEISMRQAVIRWKARLKEVGLTPAQIKQAIKLNS